MPREPFLLRSFVVPDPHHLFLTLAHCHLSELALAVIGQLVRGQSPVELPAVHILHLPEVFPIRLFGHLVDHVLPVVTAVLTPEHTEAFNGEVGCGKHRCHHRVFVLQFQFAGVRLFAARLKFRLRLGQLGLLVEVAAAEAEPPSLLQKLVAGERFTKCIVQTRGAPEEVAGGGIEGWVDRAVESVRQRDAVPIRNPPHLMLDVAKESPPLDGLWCFVRFDFCGRPRAVIEPLLHQGAIQLGQANHNVLRLVTQRQLATSEGCG
mmetsp:Transcript_16202/g.27313  ORF Transcript_16202/g.27313 Transcript_16202/m.27313 type:complete len:264 (-) Transcript_16202:134-925(-)